VCNLPKELKIGKVDEVSFHLANSSQGDTHEDVKMGVCLVARNIEITSACVGAQDARRVLIEVKSLVQSGIEQKGDFDARAIAKLLADALSGSQIHRDGVILALADFIGSAMEGAAPELGTWNPMERVRASIG
jgi:hypothetical protein